MNYGSVVEIGPATGMPAIGVPIPNPDPTQDYIATGPGRLTPKIPQLLPQEFDDVTRNFGHRTYEAMLTDPAVSSTYLALKLSILSGPVKVIPAVQPKGFRGDIGKALKASDKPTGVDRQATKLSDDERVALETAEFNERDVKRLKTPVKTTLLQLADAMAFGNKLAEKTRAYAETGPDAGRLVLDSIKVKPAWAWKFVVNAFLEVTGILTYVPPMSSGGPIPDAGQAAAQGGFLILPREKFCLFAWLPKDNDPRGTSAIRPAYDWWNLKRQQMPQHYRHTMRFGSPIMHGKLSKGATAGTIRRPIDPRTGLEIPTAPNGYPNVSEADRYTQQLMILQNNSIIVTPNDAELALVESSHDGEAFMKGFDLYDRQIVLAIGLNARASIESKNGSKADTEAAHDDRGLLVDWGKDWIGDTASREIFYDSTKLNMGEEIADKFTPKLSVGATEHQDKPAKWTSAGSIGYSLGRSQMAEMDAELDLPERDMEADEAFAQTQMEQMAAASGPESQPKPKGIPAKAGSGDDSGGKGAKGGGDK